MAPARSCLECSGKFSASFFLTPSQICSLCVLRHQMQERLKQQDEKLTIGGQKIMELTHTIETLKERLQRHENKDSGATSTTTLPPTPAPETPPPTRTPQTPPSNDASRRVDAGFTPVRRGGKTMRPIVQPTICSNRFKILEEEDEPASTFLVGDSMIRQQLTEFCGRVKRRRRVFCMPGAGIDDVTVMKDKVSEEATADTLFVIHAGTNDVRKTRSEELLDKYRKLIQQYKTKSSNIMISGVLPRIAADDLFYSKAFSLNSRLRNLCKDHGVEFVDMWNDFYNQNGLFHTDGLHLSAVGAARFGRLLSESVRRFWAKNGTSSVTETAQ